MELIRSFIAFDIENVNVLRELSKIQSALLECNADIKPVEPENIHITIRFLGEITPAMVEKVYSEMSKVVFTPFEIEIKGLGAFPSIRHINVIWAGIGKGMSELRNIYYQLEPNLQKLGLRPDDKEFSPHITIARVRSGREREKIAEIIKRYENYRFGVIYAKCLRLKKSVLTPRGPIYSTVREVCR